jgi:hypothetical protein
MRVAVNSMRLHDRCPPLFLPRSLSGSGRREHTPPCTIWREPVGTCDQRGARCTVHRETVCAWPVTLLGSWLDYRTL